MNLKRKSRLSAEVSVRITRHQLVSYTMATNKEIEIFKRFAIKILFILFCDIFSHMEKEMRFTSVI